MNIVASKFLLYGALLTALSAPASAAGDLKLIAHPDFQVNEITVAELRSIFLGTKTTLKGGGEVAPILEKGGSLLADFSREYLGKSDVALETYYRSLVFTGRWSMPVAFSSDDEVIAYVAKTRGAIGFVRQSAATPGVKTLRVR